MMKFGKKASVLILAVIMVMSFAGCSQFGKQTIDEKAVVITVDDVKVTAGLVNFWARNAQSIYEGYYSQSGTNPWIQEIERGQTYEDMMKDEVAKEIQNLYLLEKHAEEYKITLTDEELKAIDAAAEKFEKANSEDAKDKVSAKKEYAVEYLRLLTLQEKLYDSLEAKHLEEAGKDSKDTEAAKKIAEEKANEEYNSLIEKWRKSAKLTLDEKVWKQIDFQALQVMPIYDEPEKEDSKTDKESTDTTQTDKQETDTKTETQK